MSFSTGLVVGKFSPLHRGHQRVIDTALAQCREVFVISYAKPEFEGCGRAARDAWIAALYPQVTRLVIDDEALAASALQAGVAPRTIPEESASEDEHREFCGWLCLSILRTTVDAVFTSEDYGDGFAAVLTRMFWLHAGVADPVRHVCVDKPREAVPISGTRLRGEPALRTRFLSDPVRASFIERVAILGGESSGKTSLARALAERLATAWIPEYGRELWEARDGALRYGDMLDIATVQIERETQAALSANRWLICDTTPLTTASFSQVMFGEVDARLRSLAERSYDHTLLCAPDIDFVQDGTRRDEAFRVEQHDWYERQLTARGIRFVDLSGSLAKRLDTAVSALRAATRGDALA